MLSFSLAAARMYAVRVTNRTGGWLLGGMAKAWCGREIDDAFPVRLLGYHGVECDGERLLKVVNFVAF